MPTSVNDELVQGAFKIGFDLATSTQAIDYAGAQININLVTIVVEPYL